MGRVAFMEHSGKRILHLDLRGASAAESQVLMRQASELVSRHPVRSVLMLIDVTGAGLDPSLGEAVHQAATRDRPYVLAQAVIGIEGRQRVVFNVAAAVLGDATEHFETTREGLDWLASR